MFIFRTLVLVVLLLTIKIVESARILGVFNAPSVSHQIVFQPIWKELSLRGHQVTVITPNPLNDPTLINLTEIDIGSSYKFVEAIDFSRKITHWDMMPILTDFLVNMPDQQLNNSGVRSLIADETQNFDVVLAEYITPIPAAFSAKYKCPLIGVVSLNLMYFSHEAVGTPIHPVLFPDLMTTFGTELSFWERVESVLYYLWFEFNYHYVLLPKADQVAKKYLGDDIPYLGDIFSNISILLINTNPVIHKPRPLPPNVVQLGRMHFKPKKPLSKSLREFLDSADKGVIYCSFGTNVKSVYIDQEKRKIIMSVFSELPYKILWKFENDTLIGKPLNVEIRKWLPQQDLLGHPKIKLFITQGGLQSMEEAIVNKVPMLGIPFFADQFFNADRIEALGIGLKLDFETLTKDSLKGSILKILHNPRFKAKVVELSEIIQDEPMTGLEKAVWWTEFVLRHKNLEYLKNPAVKMSWCRFLLMDVIAFLLFSLVLVAYVCYKLCFLVSYKISGFVKTKRWKKDKSN